MWAHEWFKVAGVHENNKWMLFFYCACFFRVLFQSCTIITCYSKTNGSLWCLDSCTRFMQPATLNHSCAHMLRYYLHFPFPDQAEVEMKCQVHVPGPILKMVHRQNLEFLHTRSHFSYPYFQFMKQLLIVNYNYMKTRLDQSNSPEAMVS